MTRFFGWDRSGMPVREKSRYLTSVKEASFLMSEEAMASRGPRPILYDPIVELVRAIVSKAKRDAQEFRRLLNWSVENLVDPAEWPAGAVMRRLSRIYQETATEDDVEDLGLFLEDLTGDGWIDHLDPVELPFTTPELDVDFCGKEFVFAGHFLYGKPACVEDLWPRGATCGETVSERTDYLVLGALQSVAWQSGPIGEAIDLAILENERRPPEKAQVQILSEAVWFRETLGRHSFAAKTAASV